MYMEIRLKGRLKADWLEGLMVSDQAEGETVLGRSVRTVEPYPWSESTAAFLFTIRRHSNKRLVTDRPTS
jgi:hypothetical protein